jgi:hypothetical protein
MRVLWFGDGRRDRRGCLHGSNLLLAIGLLGEAKLLVHLPLKIVGGTAELADPLAKLAGEHGQALGSEEEQRQDKKNDAVLETRHTVSDDTAFALWLEGGEGSDPIQEMQYVPF